LRPADQGHNHAIRAEKGTIHARSGDPAPRRGTDGARAPRLAGAGAVVVAAPVDTPWGDRNARLAAPDGMQLTLFSLAD
jgi:hypothetical protein